MGNTEILCIIGIGTEKPACDHKLNQFVHGRQTEVGRLTPLPADELRLTGPKLLNRRLPNRERLIFDSHSSGLDVPESFVVLTFVRSRRQQVRAKG
jgi:hypothetical protein